LGGGRIADVSYSELEELSRKLNAYDDTEFRSWAVNTLQRGKLNPHSNGLKFSLKSDSTVERLNVIPLWDGCCLCITYACFQKRKYLHDLRGKTFQKIYFLSPLRVFGKIELEICQEKRWIGIALLGEIYLIYLMDQ
jgi:hypothetical protein